MLRLVIPISSFVLSLAGDELRHLYRQILPPNAVEFFLIHQDLKLKITKLYILPPKGGEDKRDKVGPDYII